MEFLGRLVMCANVPLSPSLINTHRFLTNVLFEGFDLVGTVRQGGLFGTALGCNTNDCGLNPAQ